MRSCRFIIKNPRQQDYLFLSPPDKVVFDLLILMEESDAEEVEYDRDYRTYEREEVVRNDLVDRDASEDDSLTECPCVPWNYRTENDTCIGKHSGKDCPVDVHFITDLLECDCRNGY